jgi:hypothetical protein
MVRTSTPLTAASCPVGADSRSSATSALDERLVTASELCSLLVEPGGRAILQPRGREPAADQWEGGSSVGRPVRDLEPDVGVTELAGLAPARQILAGQLLSGRLDQLRVVGQIAAEQSDRLVTPELGHRVGIAPARRPGDNHGARGFPPPWLAAELHPPGGHGTAGFIGTGARPAAGRRRLDRVAAPSSPPHPRPPEAAPGRVRTVGCPAGRTARGAAGG